MDIPLAFSTKICRSIVCAHNNVDYMNTPTLYGDVCVRDALPRSFNKMLERFIGRSLCTSKELWIDLFAALEDGLDATVRNRCIQIICEYVPLGSIWKFLSDVPVRYLEECKTALSSWYNNEPNQTTCWMRETLSFDMYVLSKITEKILTRICSPVSVVPFKRLLVYAHRLHTSSFRWYVDIEPSGENMIAGCDEAELLLLRRAYEHVLFSQKSLLDTVHPNSLLRALHRPDHAYKHSLYSNPPGQKYGIQLYDGNHRELFLYPTTKKTFELMNVQGTLELLETNSPTEQTLILRCCKSLNHHRVYGQGLVLNYLYDSGDSHSTKRIHTSSDNLSRRLTDFSAGPNCRMDNKEDSSVVVCEKKNLLHNHMYKPNQERDFATLKCYVQEYLLQELART